MAIYTDQFGNKTVVGNPDLNPDLIRGKTLVSSGDNLYTPTTITSDSLASVPQIKFPDTQPDTTNYGAIISSVPNYTDILNSYQQQSQAQLERQSQVKSYGATLDKLLGKANEQAQIEKQYKIPEYTQQLTDLNNQLTSLQNEAKAIPLQVQNDIAGRGVTKAGSATMTNDQLRTNAIKSLEISSMASALQNNLATAQSLADRAVKLKYDSIEAQIANQEKLLALNYQDLTAEQKKRADVLQMQLDARKEQVANERADRNTILGWTAEAAKLGNAPAIVISQAMNTTDLRSALNVLSPYLTDTNAKAKAVADVEYTRSQTAKNYADAAKTRADIKATVPTQTSKEIALTNDINTVLDDPSFNSTFGLVAGVKRNIPSTAQYTLASKVQNIIDQLALAARGQLKGQGAVSDFEGKMLRSAQTALKMNMNSEDAKKELIKIRGAITTSSGGLTPVKITNRKTGETQTLMAGSDGITKAVNDGLLVEYVE